MRLMKLSKYRELRYAQGSAPSMNTLRARIKEIPGGLIEHGHYYVDLDQNDSVNLLSQSIDTRQRAVAPLLEGLI